MTLINISIQSKGGPGSGNWGHRGIPGKVGGSSPRGTRVWSRAGSQYTGSMDTHDSKANTMLNMIDTGKLNAEIASTEERMGELIDRMDSLHMSQAREYEIASYEFEELDSHVMMLRMLSESSDWAYANATRRAYVKNGVVESLSEVSGVDGSEINEYMKHWAYTSNDESSRALSLQEAASEEFGVPLSDWQKGKKSEHGSVTTSVNRNTERAMLKAMYDNTQAELKKAGYKPGDTIPLFRGVLTKDLHRKGSIINYRGNVIESWSLGSNEAREFATPEDKGRGMVLSMKVPIENIISTAVTGFGCLNEGEFVILGSIPGSSSYVADVILQL